jgi:hypothetical protein
MTFRTLDTSKSVFLVQSARSCQFESVGFTSIGDTSLYINNNLGTAGVNFGSTSILITTNIVFDGCKFNGATYGAYSLQQTKGVVITNSSFATLYQGVALAVSAAINGGPSGTRITNNIFDSIYEAGIVFGRGNPPSSPATGLNASAYNIFYDVANSFGGVTIPTSSIVRIVGDKNVSIGDMFERSNLYATTFPQIDTGDSLGAVLDTNGLRIGSKTIESGDNISLLDAQTGTTAFSVNVGIVNPSVSQITSFKIDYNIVQGTKYRTGTCMVASAGGGIVTFTDDYNENSLMNVYLYASQSGSVVTFDYNTTPPSGLASTFSYSVSYLN